MRLPEISHGLIEAVESAFPNKLPAKVVSEGDLGVLVGQQKVVAFLRHAYDEQAMMPQFRTHP